MELVSGKEIDDFLSLYNWRSYFDPFGLCLFIVLDTSNNLRLRDALWYEPYYLDHIEKLDLSNIDLSFVKGDFLFREDSWGNGPTDLQIYVNRKQSESFSPRDSEVNLNGGYTFLETLLNCGFKGKLILGEINKNKLHPIYSKDVTDVYSFMYLQGYYNDYEEKEYYRRKLVPTLLSVYGNGIFIKTDVLKTFLDCLEPIPDSISSTPSFNYEVYNINEIRSEIKQKGYLIPNSDDMDKNINPSYLNLVGYTS